MAVNTNRVPVSTPLTRRERYGDSGQGGIDAAEGRQVRPDTAVGQPIRLDFEKIVDDRCRAARKIGSSARGIIPKDAHDGR